MSADSMQYLKNCHYIINNTHAGTSDQDAKFTVLLYPNDTIHFTHIGFSPVEFIVPDTLKQQSYVLGIFMQRDTVALPEIVILPRVIIDKKQMEASLEKKQKDRQNLKNNIALAKYQAAYQPEQQVWDAEMNQKYQMQKFKNDYIYAGQISPAETFNFLALVPLTYYLVSGRLFPDPPPAFKMTEHEEIKLKLYYEEQIRLQRTLEKSIR